MTAAMCREGGGGGGGGGGGRSKSANAAIEGGYKVCRKAVVLAPKRNTI